MRFWSDEKLQICIGLVLAKPGDLASATATWCDMKAWVAEGGAMYWEGKGWWAAWLVTRLDGLIYGGGFVELWRGKRAKREVVERKKPGEKRR